MDAKIGRDILNSPFPAIAAEVRWDWEQFARNGGLPQRMADMARVGIMSEVIDLIEALEVPDEAAVSVLAATYERAAEGAERIISFREAEERPDIAEQDLLFNQMCREHALGLRAGSITISQELTARIKQREENGRPENFYVGLLQNPVFPTD
jgi:hypothetical protein